MLYSLILCQQIHYIECYSLLKLIISWHGQDTLFHVIELQAKWVAKVLSGKVVLPTEEEMMESVKELYKFMEENGLPKRYTHSLRPFQVCVHFI